MLKEIYTERRQERASSLVNAKSRSNTGPVCCLLPFGCPFFIPSLTVPSSLSLFVPAKACVQGLIYSQLCGRSSKNLSHVTVKVKGPRQAVAICALTLKAHLYLRERVREKIMHGARERAVSCHLVIWIVLFCGACYWISMSADATGQGYSTQQNRQQHTDQEWHDSLSHCSQQQRPMNWSQTYKNTRTLSIVMVLL